MNDLNQFDIINGIIQNPGKFEQQNIATYYFYSLYLDGETGFTEIENTQHNYIRDNEKKMLNELNADIPANDNIYILTFNDDGSIDGFSGRI